MGAGGCDAPGDPTTPLYVILLDGLTCGYASYRSWMEIVLNKPQGILGNAAAGHQPSVKDLPFKSWMPLYLANPWSDIEGYVRADPVLLGCKCSEVL